MKARLLSAVEILQVIILWTSYLVFRAFPSNKKKWVVGTDEVAGVLESVARVLPNSYSVNLSAPGLRHGTYSLTISGNGRTRILKRIFLGPVILGFLANQTGQFFYIGSIGFLFNRSNEFRFLKRHNKKIAVMFCGDDIRSPKLHRELCEKLNRKTFVNQGFYICPPGGPEKYEQLKKEIAMETEKFADLIFNAPLCQSSYLSQNSKKVKYAHGFAAICDERFLYDTSKFKDAVIKVVHAPSSEAVKGTTYVRDAIKRLSSERTDFVYIELQNTEHNEVLKTLQQAHICLNQFLSFGTGILGIESLASHCATLMSADPNMEPSIPSPKGGAIPWLVTQVDDIYSNLKLLLDNRDLLIDYAEAGFMYARDNYSDVASKHRLTCSLAEYGFDVNAY